MLVEVQPLKSENTISSHNTDMDTYLQASIPVKTILFERLQGSEKTDSKRPHGPDGALQNP
ncbi:hypothetical protein ACSAZL_21465 [Methanosarcina sp. T3]|uniref:hypothetical protein n=1 Tax=Methanosarcina sp. T3 TaxID=3439062 RepID=UPI003F827501